MYYTEISTNKGKICAVHMNNGCTLYAYVYGYKHYYYFRVPGLHPVRYTARDLRELAPFSFIYLKSMAGLRMYKGA